MNENLGTPRDPWADFDRWKATTAVPAAFQRPGPLRLAFYGRCSTEDNQDPETSRRWQRDKAEQLMRAVSPDAEIVAEFFDIGFSRSLPWKRRPEGQRLLAELDSPDRAWDAIVVGEGQRCWFGAQFAEVAPILQDRGVDIFAPELSGRYDPKNSAHYTLMTVSGGMSLGERQRVQERVQAAMKVQVQAEGRYQGGRAPYGYRAEGYAPHPNPEKARDGKQLKRLVVDPEPAEVVRRIFDEVINGKPITQIAIELNDEAIPCPSAHDPERNKHRSGDGWQSSAVHAIIKNERYTGYEQWGKYKKEERLLNPDDPSWGNTTKFVRNPDGSVRSREQAHEAIVDVETWQEAQRTLEARGRVSQRSRAAKPRARRATKPYAMRGIVECAHCGRLMSGENFSNRSKKDASVQLPVYTRYRCSRPKELANSPRFLDHPSAIIFGEKLILPQIGEWLVAFFDPSRRDETLKAMSAARALKPTSIDPSHQRHMALLDEKTQALARLYSLVESGVGDLEMLAPRIKELQADVRELEASTPKRRAIRPDRPSEDQIAALLDDFGSIVEEVFTEADPAEVNTVLRIAGLKLRYDHERKHFDGAFDFSGTVGKPTNPHSQERMGVSVGVRGGIRTLTPIPSGSVPIHVPVSFALG